MGNITQETENGTQRAAWPHTFKFGDFVRLVYHPELWGRIVGPSGHPDRWIFEYPGGARITNGADAFELFEPTAQQRQQTAMRFAQIAAKMPAPEWPPGAAL